IYMHYIRYLMIECEDVAVNKMYGKVSYQYMSAMTASGIHRRESLRRQGELIQTLANLAKNIKQMRDSRPKKVPLELKRAFFDCLFVQCSVDAQLICSSDFNIYLF